MKRLIGSIAVTAAIGALGFATPALALTKATDIIGSMGITQETCLQGSDQCRRQR